MNLIHIIHKVYLVPPMTHSYSNKRLLVPTYFINIDLPKVFYK